MLAKIQINTKANVTVVFLAFFVSNVTNVFKKPLFSIIPIPKRIIIRCGKTAKFAKLDTVFVNMFIMLIITIIMAIFITHITENIIAKKVPKYEFENNEELEEDLV